MCKYIRVRNKLAAEKVQIGTSYNMCTAQLNSMSVSPSHFEGDIEVYRLGGCEPQILAESITRVMALYTCPAPHDGLGKGFFFPILA